jgi:hypothetical protein
MKDEPSSTLSQRCVACAAFLGLVTLLVAPHVLTAPRNLPPLPPARTTLDPNTAPWWELAALPEVGESTAKEIVAYRQAHAKNEGGHPDSPVFRRLLDLDAVRGIGPKTLQRIGPYLRFDAD